MFESDGLLGDKKGGLQRCLRLIGLLGDKKGGLQRCLRVNGFP